MVHALVALLTLVAPARASAKCDGLLLNAEAFGFGPTAAIAQVYPKLRRDHGTLGFIGAAHALEMQRDLNYDHFTEIPPTATDAEVSARLRDLRAHYSHFFTALDFRYARLARAEGYRVGAYDPLTWFWSPLPPEIKDLDLYVAQSFASVADRLSVDISTERSKFPDLTWVVAPITPRLHGKPIGKRSPHALINLGGLRNPYMPDELTREYAVTVARLCDEVMTEFFKRNELTAKPGLVHTVPGTAAFTPKRMHHQLERVRLALLTPGLGSLFEASAAGTPVVWLPPTNDSQGQQLTALEARDLIDARLSWADVTGEPPIDYHQTQPKVMNEIARRMRRLIDHESVRDQFRAGLRERVQSLLAQKQDLKLPRLIHAYGTGGTNELAQMIQLWTSYDR